MFLSCASRALVVCFATGAISAGAAAQLDRIDPGWDEPRSVMPTPAEELAFEHSVNEDRDRRIGGLMREGAHLMSVRGAVRKGEDAGTWIARLILDGPGGQVYERDMRLLPNAFLAELREILESSPTQRPTFEMTGELLVYQGRNYLLLRAPARVTELGEGATETEFESSDDPGDGSDARHEVESQTEHGELAPPPRGATDVMRDLERRSGPLHRSVHREDSREATADKVPFREGALLVQRRGRVTRDAGGAWMFVFDADSQGLADPPLTLMPCLLLERIEKYARRVGPTAPILMSGQVFLFDGRGYLLPTSFQLPRERTMIN